MKKTENRETRLRGMAAAFIALLAPSFPAGSVTGTLESDASNFGLLANDTTLYYPGELVTLTIDKNIDANHTYRRYKVKCGFLGLSRCWQTDSIANWVGPDELPVELRFATVDTQAQVANPDAQIPTIRVTTREAALPVITAVNASMEGLMTGYRLIGRVSDTLTSGGRLSRQSCKTLPSSGTCSLGGYDVTIADVDVSARLDLLRRALERQALPSTRLMSEHFVTVSIRRQRGRDNRIKFADGVGPSERAARLLVQHVDWHKTAFTSIEREAILRFIVDNLDDQTPAIRNRLTALYIENGNIAAGKSAIGKDLAEATARYEAEKAAGSFSPETVCALGTATENAASLNVQDRVMLSSADLSIAGGFYQKAADLYREHSALFCGENDIISDRRIRALVNQARVLALVRTRGQLYSSADILEEARKIAKDPAAPPESYRVVSVGTSLAVGEAALPPIAGIGIIVEQHAVSSTSSAFAELFPASDDSVLALSGGNGWELRSIASAAVVRVPSDSEQACLSNSVRPIAVDMSNGRIAFRSDDNKLYWLAGEPPVCNEQPVTSLLFAKQDSPATLLTVETVASGSDEAAETAASTWRVVVRSIDKFEEVNAAVLPATLTDRSTEVQDVALSARNTLDKALLVLKRDGRLVLVRLSNTENSYIATELCSVSVSSLAAPGAKLSEDATRLAWIEDRGELFAARVEESGECPFSREALTLADLTPAGARLSTMGKADFVAYEGSVSGLQGMRPVLVVTGNPVSIRAMRLFNSKQPGIMRLLHREGRLDVILLRSP